MSIVIDLPQTMENEISKKAIQSGLSVPEYILQLLSSSLVTHSKPETGTELVEYWQREGLIGDRPEIVDSQLHARQLREEAEHRERG